MSDTESKQKALKAISDAFADNGISYEEAINIMAAYTKHIGQRCGSKEGAAVMMIRALDKLMPELKDRL